MGADTWAVFLVGLALIVANAFFVATEYGLVGARRSKLESLAKKGSRQAQLALNAIKRMAESVATLQVCVTVCSIALGAIVEPALTVVVSKPLHFLPQTAIQVISILLVTVPLVVVGELVPKYLTLRAPERTALLTLPVVTPIRLAILPLVWLIQRLGEWLLKPFGIAIHGDAQGSISREELALLVRSSMREGLFEEAQGGYIQGALKLDKLDAADVMIHRLDVKWIDKRLGLDEIEDALGRIPHSRIPVCDGDIDEVVGILYIQEFLRHRRRPDFALESVLRPAEFVPESLTLDRVVQRMREAKTQILIVRDEYGGTSGMLTLEDVVEEVFGELEDSLESDRPPIEQVGADRVSARSDVRYDELIEFLGMEPDDADTYTTETLAEIVMTELGHVPRVGDSVSLPIGKLRVENMARRRVTRVALIQGR
jgi:CBS domain containing-hemolysin-like protein